MSTPASGIWIPTEPAIGAGMSDLTYICLCLAGGIAALGALCYAGYKVATVLEDSFGWNEIPAALASFVVMLLALAGLGAAL